MDKLQQLERDLKDVYDEFIDALSIDKESGIINSGEPNEIRFSGYAYVGERYCEATPKILFYGLDLGSDELKSLNTYHNFETRRSRFMGGSDMKDHHRVICSIYMIALGVIGENLGFEGYNRLADSKGRIDSVISRISKTQDEMGEYTKQSNEVLRYISFSNMYKFVARGRDDKSGGADRIWYNRTLGSKRQKLLKKKTIELLRQEVELMSPDVVVVMSKNPYFLEPILKSLSCKYILITHPSARKASGMVNQLRGVVNEINNM